MKTLNYRSDIDGLRGVAVLLVILFHAEIQVFQGGYIGVDVFFVISGYLITRLIRHETLAGTFRFSRFYMRRIRRLFPSFAFTLVCSALAAYYLLSPPQLERFSDSLFFASVSLSNFYFLLETDYFDLNASFKPLLHLWSLSVEEQFYLVWPFVLVILLAKTPRWAVPVFLLLAGAASLYLNGKAIDGLAFLQRYLYLDGPATIFYLPIFRVFEFAIGVGVVWMERRPLPNKLVATICSLLGVTLITIAALTYSKFTPFPTYYALLPCLGTALVIYAGPTTFANKALSYRWLVGVGLVSYSLYLIHWPVFVFYKHFKIDNLNHLETLLLIGASVIAAVLMYRFIEQPFRRQGRFASPQFSKKLSLAAVSATALIALLPQTELFTSGANVKTNVRFPAFLEKYNDPHYHYLWSHYRPRERVPFEQSDARILIVGDSQSADILNVLMEGGVGRRASVRTHELDIKCGNLPAPLHIWENYAAALPALKNDPQLSGTCKTASKRFLEGLNLKEATTVILASLWKHESLPFLLPTIRHLKKSGEIRVVVVGRKNLQRGSVDMYNAYTRKLSRASEFNVTDLRNFAHNFRNTDSESVNQILAQFAYGNEFRFLNPLDYICPLNEGCLVIAGDSKPAFFDATHLTEAGAAELGPSIVRDLFPDLRPR